MGWCKDSSGFVLFVKLAKVGRDGDFSSFALFVQLPRFVGWGKLECQWIRFLCHVD